MIEQKYKVVWPLGKLAYRAIALQSRVSDFKNKTICELSDYGFRAEAIFPIIRESLQKLYPGIKFVEYPEFGNTHGPKEAEVIANLPELIRTRRCDAIISGVGG